MEDQVVEAVVCHENDLPENGMKNFKFDEGEVLLVRQNSKISAIGSKCTHYGAPLVKGVLGADGTVRCPWHGACFNSTSGDIEDFPGLDSLPCYSVSLGDAEEEGKGRPITIRAKKSQLLSNKRVKALARRDPENTETIVVVGGGGAGSSCIEGLRQSGFSGRLLLVSAEESLPYDRPKLSKNMAATPDSIALRPLNYYESGDVELMLGNPVLSLNSEAKQLLLNGGQTVKYDKLFIATGGVPRSLTCPGHDLEGVMLLRTPQDAKAILEGVHQKHVVIVGTSFIGMEAASHFATLGACESISVVGSSPVAYQSSLGEEVGGRLQELVRQQGVAFHNSDSVVEIRGHTRVQEVVLKSGTVLPASVVLLGIGVTPATDFLEGSAVSLDDRGHVIVDQYLQSNVEGVYCGGDIAAFPLRYGGVTHQEKVSIGHWQVAQYHGLTAATNLLSAPQERRPVDSVPVFWTVLMGKSVRYAGYGGSYDDVLISGDLAELSFIAHYAKGDQIVAVASMGRDPAVANFAEILRSGKEVTRQMVEADPEFLLAV